MKNRDHQKKTIEKAKILGKEVIAEIQKKEKGKNKEMIHNRKVEDNGTE
jgi:hypothetical protein